MRDAIEKYLEETLCHADLSAADERGTRAELAEHLHRLVESFPNSNPKELYAMLKEQFGNPKTTLGYTDATQVNPVASSTFGKITSTATNPRIIQFAAKFQF